MEEIVKKKLSPLWFVIPLCVIAIGFLCYIPFWINSAYLKGGGYETVWTGAEFLAFYGAALSAIGALGLGALSLWQNHVQRVENEKSQKRLEGINKASNEINIKSIFVKNESERIKELSKLCNEFYELSISNKIIDLTKQYQDQAFAIGLLKFELIRYNKSIVANLKTDFYSGEEPENLANATNTLLLASNAYLDQLQAIKGVGNVPQETIDGLVESAKVFSTKKDNYLIGVKEYLTQILLGEIGIERIKELLSLSKEEQNGQDEDAE